MKASRLTEEQFPPVETQHPLRPNDVTYLKSAVQHRLSYVEAHMRRISILLVGILATVAIGLSAQAAAKVVRTTYSTKGSSAGVAFSRYSDCINTTLEIVGIEGLTKAEPGAPERSNTVTINYHSWNNCPAKYISGSITLDGVFSGQKIQGATVHVNTTITLITAIWVYDPWNGWVEVDTSNDVPLVIDLTWTASGSSSHGTTTSHSSLVDGSYQSRTVGDYSEAVVTGQAVLGGDDFVQGSQILSPELGGNRWGTFTVTKYTK